MWYVFRSDEEFNNCLERTRDTGAVEELLKRPVPDVPEEDEGIEEFASFYTADLPGDFEEGAEKEDSPIEVDGWGEDEGEIEDEDLTEDIRDGSSGETKTAGKYVWANVKVISWIPYIPHGKKLPAHFYLPYFGREYRGVSTAGANLIEEKLLQEMFAVGNPPPPKEFKTKKSFADFVRSKEYRAIHELRLLVCCKNGQVTRDVAVPVNRVGYTPPASSVPVGRLHQDHKQKECMLSMIERLDAMLSLRIIPPPYSFARGNYKAVMQKATRGKYLFADSKFGFQVNDEENKLYFFASQGHLLPYMWTRIALALTCDGLLMIGVLGSAIPSSALYINNKQVATYSMLGELMPELRRAMYGGGRNFNNPSGAPYAPRSLKPIIALKPHAVVNYLGRGCPRSYPRRWPYGL